MEVIDNAAAFLGGRRMKGLVVEYDNATVTLKNRVSGDTIKSYSVVEVAKAGMAWDVVDDTSQEPGARLRLVVQQGCGCGGMKPYTVDSSYSGALAR